jgi:hypothetical protein
MGTRNRCQLVTLVYEFGICKYTPHAILQKALFVFLRPDNGKVFETACQRQEGGVGNDIISKLRILQYASELCPFDKGPWIVPFTSTCVELAACTAPTGGKSGWQET